MATRSLIHTFITTRSTKKLLSCKRLANSVKDYSLWTSENTVKSPFRDIVVPSRSIPEQIWENMEIWADKTAFVCALTNRSYTYHQIYKYSRNFAAKLRVQLGIKDGDVVCIMMPNSPEYPIAVLGALQAGAEVTTVNPIYTAHEVQKQLKLSDPKLVIGVAETMPAIKESLSLAQKNIPIMAVKGSDDSIPAGTILFEEFAFSDNVDHSVLKDVRKQSEDIALLPYSSGTTGLPKGVELLHRNIVANLIQMDVDQAKHYEDTTKTHQQSTLGVLPFYHIYGLAIGMLHTLAVGIKVATLPRFQPATFMKAVRDHKIDILYAAPPLLLFLGSYADVRREDLASIKTITSGAAPVPNADINRVLDKLQPTANFLQVYGLTETSPLATTMIPELKKYSSVGYAVSSSELKIVDSELRVLGRNEVGELLIKGPHIMKGYRNNPEATKNAIIEDGWFRTGDLASIDEDGVVTIADRLKELIKVKGYQVPPAELESVLKTHPDVLDAGVIGVPDPRTGETPKAFVVLKDGKKTDSKDIVAFVTERVAEYKRIKDVMFLDALPKNASGKLLRRVLKEKYA